MAGTKLGLKTRKTLLSVHILAGALWLGTGLSITAVSLSGFEVSDGIQVRTVASSLKIIDDCILVPSAIIGISSPGG